MWIALADVERVTNEIVGAIPAFWNDSLQAYERPTPPDTPLDTGKNSDACWR